jgi:hypothetical protein
MRKKDLQIIKNVDRRDKRRSNQGRGEKMSSTSRKVELVKSGVTGDAKAEIVQHQFKAIGGSKSRGSEIRLKVKWSECVVAETVLCMFVGVDWREEKHLGLRGQLTW